MTDAIDVLNPSSITGYRAPFLPDFGIHRDYGRCDFDVNKVFHLSGLMSCLSVKESGSCMTEAGSWTY